MKPIFGLTKLLSVLVFLLLVQAVYAQNSFSEGKQTRIAKKITALQNADGTMEWNGVIFGPYLTDLMKEKSSYEEEVTVIFTFEDAEIAKKTRPQLQKLGGEFVGPEFEILPFQGVNAHLSEVLAMTKIEGVAGVWHNRKMDQTMHQAIFVSSVADVRADQDFTALNDGLQVTGRGVGVVVNDSGFDGDDSDIQTTQEGELHPRNVEQVRGNGFGGSLNYQESAEADTDQANGHGSHCMGIVGGDGRHSNGKITGVAPGATMVGYGSGVVIFVLDGIGGFEYTLKHHKDYNIRIISNSFGQTADSMFTDFSTKVNKPYNIATKAVTDAGVIVVFAAGNAGPTDGKIGGDFITAPWVIGVSNGTKDGKLATSSSPGRKDPNREHVSMREEVTIGGVDYLWENRPTITAPGTDIIAVRSTGGALGPLSALNDAGLEPSEIPYYTFLTGTSMACPHIAGIIALMIEANPKIEWRAAKAVLQRTAIDEMEKQIYQRGAGYVNAWACVAAAYHGLCDTEGIENPTYEQKYGLPTDGSFGFDHEDWKTCPLHPEVEMRMKDEIPLPTGEFEVECGPGQPPLTDLTGGAEEQPTSPFFDIKEVRFENENENDFEITMELDGGLAGAPVSVAGGTVHYYDVHFRLTKPASGNETITPDITYIVSSYREALGDVFKLTVKSEDGTTRPSQNAFHYDDITGTWDDVNNTITWVVPKANLDVSSPPEVINNSNGGSTTGTRDSRAARVGDILASWEAYTYERPPGLTPDGAGVYNDSAKGTCKIELKEE